MGGRLLLLICTLAATGLLGSGCGSSNHHAPPPSCLQAAPCGGDVVGSWSFLGGCQNLAESNKETQLSCPGAAIQGLSRAFSGQLTFNADSTYSASNWRQVIHASETVPLSCAGVTSCALLNTNTTDTTGTISISCTGSATCSCQVAATNNVASDAGTFTTYGTSLTMAGLETSGSFEYCVQGDLLHLLSVSPTLDSTGQPVVLSDVVAQRTP